MEFLGSVFSRERQLMKLDRMLRNVQTPNCKIQKHIQHVLKRVSPDEPHLKQAIINACTARRPDIEL